MLDSLGPPASLGHDAGRECSKAATAPRPSAAVACPPLTRGRNRMTFTMTVRIRGRVQGVGYRAWLAREAGWRGVRGWVRNRRDGSVEALLAGEEAAVRALVEACRQGPPAARVRTVDAVEGPPFDGGGFVQLPTE